MLSRGQHVQLSKLLALMLRHQPERFGILLDAEGYASLEEVMNAVQAKLPTAKAADLHHLVANLDADKRRFSILGAEIRANYGHSLTQRIEHPPATPPDVLLHGTSQSAVTKILRDGILPMQRQYVHLTTDHDLAMRIGGRHGKAQVIVVDAAPACAAGVVFYRANDAFWLADAIPARYVHPSV